MEPENITTTQEGNKKKYFAIATVIVLAIAGAAYWYLFMQKDTNMPAGAVPVAQENKLSAADTAKLKILKDLAEQASTSATSQSEKLRILKTLQAKAPANTASSTTERLKILQELASSTPQ